MSLSADPLYQPSASQELIPIQLLEFAAHYVTNSGSEFLSDFVSVDLGAKQLLWFKTGSHVYDVVDLAELETVLEEREEYREQFGVRDPAAVSLLETAAANDVGETWETLAEWKTAHKPAELLDAARRDEAPVGGPPGRIDA